MQKPRVCCGPTAKTRRCCRSYASAYSGLGCEWYSSECDTGAKETKTSLARSCEMRLAVERLGSSAHFLDPGRAQCCDLPHAAYSSSPVRDHLRFPIESLRSAYLRIHRPRVHRHTDYVKDYSVPGWPTCVQLIPLYCTAAVLIPSPCDGWFLALEQCTKGWPTYDLDRDGLVVAVCPLPDKVHWRCYRVFIASMPAP
jgi:hypothetical protein